MSAVVETLRTYITSNPTIQQDFNKALNTALSSNIPILVQYRIKTHPVLFYYVLDLLPNTYQTPIHPTGGWTWLSQWLVEYSKEIGKWLHTPESLGEVILTSFWNAKNYHMRDYIVPLAGWKSFNAFFAREINSSVRPIMLRPTTESSLPINQAISCSKPAVSLSRSHLIENPILGLVAVLPIGMAQVSSVVLQAKAGDVIKGDQISYFQFGGSDVVSIVQKDANVRFTACAHPPPTTIMGSRLESTLAGSNGMSYYVASLLFVVLIHRR
ncbi:hypothetical protein M422DRAFT_35236 [Sphaerobolus stellatus SS14]|uniref:Phosphatidylserine decarboxylase n=1 Tax=Sphaerobolus stellatus (strain SS14) TaxID=990650 RepID=A0A0C9TUN0_SPHS4|nr:hypothetical protein M422DRAFT_35236 [Sphaerobolus stellatus SS14]